MPQVGYVHIVKCAVGIDIDGGQQRGAALRQFFLAGLLRRPRGREHRVIRLGGAEVSCRSAACAVALAPSRAARISWSGLMFFMLATSYIRFC